MDNHTPVSPNHLEKRYNEGIRKITWRDKLIKMALGALLIDWEKIGNDDLETDHRQHDECQPNAFHSH